MKIEIKLADIDFCEGCPCLSFDNVEDNVCGMAYPIPADSVYEDDGSRKWTERPEICKQTHGD